MTVEQIIKTKEFSEFYQNALEFCESIDNYKTKSKVDFLEKIRQNLLCLYSAGLKLQLVDLQSDVDFDENIDDQEFKNVLKSIGDRLQDARYYWHVFDPTNVEDNELVCGDLLDDLGDIYKDLKYSIMIFNLDKPDCQESALWQFKFDFDEHWNDHCINALTAIHYYLENE
ncbi:MAG: DUF5063 domain-containing protein [Chloroflexota bacterium]